MRPDLRPDTAGTPRPLPPRSDLAAAPDGLPPAWHRARRLLRRARADEALAEIESVFLPSGLWSGPDAVCPSCDRAKTLHQASLLRAWCLIELKRHADAEEWLAKARRLGHVDAAAADAAVVAMNLALFRGEYDDVCERAAGLLAGRTVHAADRTDAELRLVLGAALRWQGALQEAAGHVEYAHAAFTVLDEPVRTAVAANFLGWTYLSLGRLDDSRRWFEKALDLNAELDAPLRLAQNYQNLAIVCYKQGDYEPAVELLGKELALVAALPDMTCRAKLALGQVRRLRGEHEPARAVLLAAYSLAREHAMAREETLALEFLGDVLRDEGKPAEAREFYRRGMAVARRIAPRGDLVMELLRREGECLDLEGRHADANRVLNEALQMAQMVGDRFETAVIRRCLGLNASHLGRWSQARIDLTQAGEELKALTARHEAMITAYHLAQVLARLGKTAEGGRSRRRAVDEAWQQALRAQQLNQELGVPHLAEEIGGLVSGLARRRLQDDSEQPLWQVFSARRAPASRVVAVSAAMQQVLRRCDGFARYDNPVLLMGEPGTGRSLLARRVHEHGPRGARPFLRIVVAEDRPEALAAELFGVAADAGDGPRQGLVARADGGSLLLDGIEHLPRPLQRQILLLIQEGQYRQVGGTRDLRADVRIIATCAADLSHMADQGSFRTDLYFRLRLMTVTVPPLRGRTEDVVPMLDHFLTRLEGSTLGARAVFDPGSLQVLLDHAWPGNAAELEAVAQQAWFLRDQGRALHVRRRPTPAGDLLEFEESADDDATGHPSGLNWDTLSSLIDRAGGNKARTARNLGVSRMTLYRWLKELDPEAS